MCRVHLLDLTRDLHRENRPDDRMVHFAVATLLFADDVASAKVHSVAVIALPPPTSTSRL
ncbi:hypothetical protein IU438_27205 [Nocardia cyriacigeorgica]|uniref:hypothetical protein n=1 Tax=Nocardia cyriacigeorgica TaxID=135487 RepID=UPI0018954430|nr:hypothetical protein [Nocardia cyriacigeorgica]MBF6399463.1 hypothetical protein [Nocardia cyriacigeorgica]MBF6405093.1 hypothetical protein [Nocardia cyriacigeorgica]